MESIIQKDQLGCGIACTAKVLSLDYVTTKKLFSKKENGFLCTDIVCVLRKFGVMASYSYIGNKKIKYKNKDIVFIKRSKRYPEGHYLIRIDGLWMDSWINFSVNCKLKNAQSGYRKKLPGKAIYLIRG